LAAGANLIKLGDAEVRSIIIALPSKCDLVAEGRRLRIWLKDHGLEPPRFKYHLENSSTFVIVVEFTNDNGVDQFKTHFDGNESGFINADRKQIPETMGTVCWWRLMAEEIRTEHDGFSCSSARETMSAVARCYENMAAHLEMRLVEEAKHFSSSAIMGRFVFA
jgi:hypothetical protein